MKIALDKKKHFGITWYLMTLVGVWMLVLGVIVDIVAILGKEYYDYKHPESHTADWSDVLAGFVGMFAGILTIALLYVLNPFETWFELQSYTTVFLLFGGFCFYWTWCRVGGNKLF